MPSGTLNETDIYTLEFIITSKIYMVNSLNVIALPSHPIVVIVRGPMIIRQTWNVAFCGWCRCPKWILEGTIKEIRTHSVIAKRQITAFCILIMAAMSQNKVDVIVVMRRSDYVAGVNALDSLGRGFRIMFLCTGEDCAHILTS